jgi:hypothetical protein
MVLRISKEAVEAWALKVSLLNYKNKRLWECLSRIHSNKIKLYLNRCTSAKTSTWEVLPSIILNPLAKVALAVVLSRREAQKDCMRQWLKIIT